MRFSIFRAACLSIGLYVGFASANDPGLRPEALKDLALDLHVEAAGLEAQQHPLEPPKLSICLSNASLHLIVVGASISIDDAAPLNLPFTIEDADGFKADGLAVLTQLDPVPGRHRIQAHVEYRAPGTDERKSIDYSGELTQSDRSQFLELQLDQTLILGTELQPTIWVALPPDQVHHFSILALPELDRSQPREFEIGASDDPRVRVAAFMGTSHRGLTALSQLLKQSPPPDAGTPYVGWSLALADSSIRFGALDHAVAALDRLSHSGAKPSTWALLRVRLAEAFSRRERYDDAEVQLDTAWRDQTRRDRFPPVTLLAWLDARAQLYMAQGRYDDASRILLGAKHELRYEDYVRYFNLGAALIRNGRGAKGATVLDRIGRLLSSDHLVSVVRDEANLELGYYFLHEKQGRTALPILDRISLEGPQATQALLGIGWAWLAPPGEKQHRIELGDEREQGIPPESRGLSLPDPGDQNLYQRYNLRPFARARIPDDEEAQLRRALVVWSELSRRDREDPAVHEGLLAISLALDRIGAHEDAAKYLAQAVAAMDQTHRNLVQAEQYVVAGQWIDAIARPDEHAEPGSDWIEKDLPTPSASIYLQSLLAGNRFQQTLRDYRDLLLLRLHLQDLQRRLAGLDQSAAVVDLRSRIAERLPGFTTAEDDARAKLQSLAFDDLQKQGDRNETLLTSARFRLARTYDRVKSDPP